MQKLWESIYLFILSFIFFIRNKNVLYDVPTILHVILLLIIFVDDRYGTSQIKAIIRIHRNTFGIHRELHRIPKSI